MKQITAVPLSVEPAQPVRDPFYQETPKPTFSEVENCFKSFDFFFIGLLCNPSYLYISVWSNIQAMESCPKKEIPNFKELLQEENFYLTTEV